MCFELQQNIALVMTEIMTIKNLSEVIKQKCFEIACNPNQIWSIWKQSLKAALDIEKSEMVVIPICIFYFVNWVRPFLKVKCYVYNSLIQMPTK